MARLLHNNFLPIIVLVVCISIKGRAEIPMGSTNVATHAESKQTPLTAKNYAWLFKERRKEHISLLKQMLKSSYEKNFKLLRMAYEQIFKILTANNNTLQAYNYRPEGDGFPQDDIALQESVILMIENCCIAAESVLRFPEISYRILNKNHASNWKSAFNWCIGFVHALPHITDEPTVKMMDVLREEINEELRSENYMNPYYKEQNEAISKDKPKKLPKKLKKGPQLAGGRNEL